MSVVCFARKNSHDCCAPSENVTEAQYVKNLGVIYEAAHAALAPGGKILWVSTTPAPTDVAATRVVTLYFHLTRCVPQTIFV